MVTTKDISPSPGIELTPSQRPFRSAGPTPVVPGVAVLSDAEVGRRSAIGVAVRVDSAMVVGRGAGAVVTAGDELGVAATPEGEASSPPHPAAARRSKRKTTDARTLVYPTRNCPRDCINRQPVRVPQPYMPVHRP